MAAGPSIDVSGWLQEQLAQSRNSSLRGGDAHRHYRLKSRPRITR
jgi:hypothetical protein